MKVLILAAGLGKRMKSEYPKVVHKVLDKPMINWVIDTGKKFGKCGVIVGHKAEIVRKYLPEDVDVFIQQPQLGTGHAVMCAKEFIDDDILILYGDVPLISYETLHRLKETHERNKNDVTVLVMNLPNPTGYGRIVKNGDKIKIVEDKDASLEEKKITLVNTGIYIFRKNFLLENLPKLRNDNAQREYYLTDLVEMAQKVSIVEVENVEEVSGVNDRVQLATLNAVAKEIILERLMLSGVTVVDPASTFIGPDVEIGQDTVIEPFTFIYGKTKIGKNCVIGPYTRIFDSVIEDNSSVVRSEVEKAYIKENVSVGPFSRLREGTVLNEKVKIGNFVETKKTVIGKNSKAQHLTYLGDATIGEDVNIGAGTITCNYDGKNKYPTHIGDGAFIGSNSSLVAPVKIGKNALVGAGSVITEDVPDESLALGRAKQINKEGWVAKKREEK